MIIFLGVVVPIILGILLLMIEAFISGWSVDLNQWENLPKDGQIIDRR